jgi:hypothetical protein
MGTVSIIALCLAGVSLVLSAVAYWRAGGRREVEAVRLELAREAEAVRARQRAMAEELGQRVRTGYEDSLARIKRAEERLAELRDTMAAQTRQAVDALRAQLAEARKQIDAGLQRLKTDASARAAVAEEAVHKRVLRMEGRVQLVVVRAEMVRAERLADKGDFARAQDLLEDAVNKVREVKLRLTDAFEEDPAFRDVLVALQDAIRSVRTEAADHQRRIDRVLAASDALLASLATREQSIV